MDRNAQIRLQIMLIAIIGGGAFLLYLSINISLATVNANRLDDLQGHHYPIIEQIRMVKQDLISLRETYASAIGMEDTLLLEDSSVLAQSIIDRLSDLQQRDEHLRLGLMPINQSVNEYITASGQLAQNLIANPAQLTIFEASMEQPMAAYYNAMETLNGLLRERERLYGNLLAETKTAVNRANLWGSLLGGVVILVLIGLAWGVARKVLRNINESDRLKDQFLATISHELRTPMNGIIGAHSLLQETQMDEHQNSWLEIARRSSTKMISTIDDLLQFSEISAGKAQVVEEECKLRNNLDKLLIDTRKDCQEKQIEFVCDVGAIVDQTIVSNQNRILFVIRHLLSNALKFTDQGYVRFSINEVPAPDLGGDTQIRVVVTDSGPGIPEDYMEKLERPFNQLDGSFSRKHQGMGIGLATCFAITQLLRGKLQLSNTSKGLQVEFAFPVNRPAPIQPAQPQTPRQLKTVLVAEDNKVNAMVLAGLLQRMNVNVVSVEDGNQVLEALQARTVDLILMDCQMPNMDGLEACRQIRKLPEPLCQIPIIAVTANASEEDKRNCFRAGMNAFMRKPVTLGELKAEIAGQLLPRPLRIM